MKFFKILPKENLKSALKDKSWNSAVGLQFY